GTYKLEPGEYTYTISKPGYKETTGTITITDRDETITVTLEEIKQNKQQEKNRDNHKNRK
ncbi:PEGA domain-containing protein, partial [Sporotomaculum syntrophicum]|uniref:PEGA domain-containing protein n=1 Tax=Sporotomaculum syntrophicum TaxID=182264 RepID=UPI00137A51BA